MLALAVALAFAASPAAGSAGLQKARALVDEFQFPKARAALAETLQEPGLELATLISLYELEGIVAATQGDATAAKAAFAKLLTLDPARAVPNELPPKGRTFFFAARTVAQREALSLEAVPPERVGGLVETLTVTVGRSALLPATAVRFTVSVDGAAPVTTSVPLGDGAQVSTKVRGARVKWSAVLLTARDAVLRQVERDEVPPPVALPPPPPPVVVTAPPPPTGTWLKPVGFVLGGLGLAAVGVGVGFGVTAADARAKLASASTDANGVVTGLTQVQAQQLDATARGNAPIANALLVGGGVLTAAGVLFVVLAPSETPAPLALSVGPAGAVISGQF